MRGLEMEFSPSAEMDKIQDLTDDFFEHVLYDEKPLFVSDEATIWDVSTSEAPDLIIRLSQHYQKPVDGRPKAASMETASPNEWPQILSSRFTGICRVYPP